MGVYALLLSALLVGQAHCMPGIRLWYGLVWRRLHDRGASVGGEEMRRSSVRTIDCWNNYRLLLNVEEDAVALRRLRRAAAASAVPNAWLLDIL